MALKANHPTLYSQVSQWFENQAAQNFHKPCLSPQVRESPRDIFLSFTESSHFRFLRLGNVSTRLNNHPPAEFHWIFDTL